MVVNSLPDTVWLFYYSRKVAVAADEVATFSQNIFQRILSDEEYVRLVDARTGEVIRIYAHINRRTGIPLSTICIKLNRTIRCNGQIDEVGVEYWVYNDGNRPVLTLMNFEIPPVAQGKGLATQMFAAQVAAARNLGFNQIVGYADYRRGRNGYYTWPRLGFDKQLTSEEQKRLAPEFRHLTSLSYIMEHPESRKWWRKYGSTLGFDLLTTFDTSPQSRSMQNLQAALVSLDQKNGYWDSGPDMPLCIERGTSLRPRRDWLSRIWVYRQR